MSVRWNAEEMYWPEDPDMEMRLYDDFFGSQPGFTLLVLSSQGR